MRTNNVCKFPMSTAENDLSVFCFVYETNETIMKQNTAIAHYRMILVEQGEGIFEVDGVSHPFSAGTLFFCFEGESLVLSQGEGVRYFYIDFDGARVSKLFKRFGIYPYLRKTEKFNGAIPFCKESLFNAQQENIDIISESVLLYVFSRLSSQGPTQNATIKRVIEITEENFQDPELSLTVIADEIGYNPKYLSNFFKEKMNITYGEYLRSLRFKYAISLFEHGISSVKNVALLSGFSDPLYFSNAFKKAVGVSPKEFIQAHERKGESGL